MKVLTEGEAALLEQLVEGLEKAVTGLPSEIRTNLAQVEKRIAAAEKVVRFVENLLQVPHYAERVFAVLTDSLKDRDLNTIEVGYIPLSPKTAEALTNGEVKTIGELVSMTEEEIIAVWRCNEERVALIKEALGLVGLGLRKGEPRTSWLAEDKGYRIQRDVKIEPGWIAFSQDTRHLVAQLGVETTGELAAKTPEDFYAVVGRGSPLEHLHPRLKRRIRVAIAEVARKLVGYGLCLTPSPLPHQTTEAPEPIESPKRSRKRSCLRK